MIQDGAGGAVGNAVFMVSVAFREEKGSDVNVASHLLSDVLLGEIDAAVVVSNDSDLQLPVNRARLRVPVGLINPGSSQTAGALCADDYTRHQLPNPAQGYRSPLGW